MSYDPNDFWFSVSFLSISFPHNSPDAARCGNEPKLPFIAMYLPDVLPMYYYAAFYIEQECPGSRIVKIKTHNSARYRADRSFSCGGADRQWVCRFLRD